MRGDDGGIAPLAERVHGDELEGGLIPLAGSEPETWEIQGQVFRRAQPFGLPRDLVERFVKP